MNKPDFQALSERATLTIETLPEDSPVDCFACGDTDPETLAYEARENAKLSERLECGDVWAWCIVRVIASSPSGLVGDAYLGGCSYADEAGFRADGFEELAEEARADLARVLARIYALNFEETKGDLMSRRDAAGAAHPDEADGLV